MGLNGFFEKENTGDRGREWGFAQSAACRSCFRTNN